MTLYQSFNEWLTALVRLELYNNALFEEWARNPASKDDWVCSGDLSPTRVRFADDVAKLEYSVLFSKAHNQELLLSLLQKNIDQEDLSFSCTINDEHSAMEVRIDTKWPERVAIISINPV